MLFPSIRLRKMKLMAHVVCLRMTTRIDSRLEAPAVWQAMLIRQRRDILPGSTRQASYFWDAGVSVSDESRSWDSPETAMLGCKWHGVLARTWPNTRGLPSRASSSCSSSSSGLNFVHIE